MGGSASTPEPARRPEPEMTPEQREETTLLIRSLFSHFPLFPLFPELEGPWRNFNWEEKAALVQHLEEFSVSDPRVPCIKIMLVGAIGAGKSSFINSVNNAFRGCITSTALVDSSAACSSFSFTQRLRTHRVRTANSVLPFAFCDVMGLEPEEMSGVQPGDVINAIFGHVKEDYKFNQGNPITPDSQHYRRNPELCDQAFCVVYIIDTDTVQFMEEQVIEKLRIIRRTVSERGIPQVVVMTKVDEACYMVKSDLKNIYSSRKIKHKMELCSAKVGVPMNNIFPVKNYHEEIDTDDNIDVLILKAVEQIVHLANDRLMDEIVP